MRELEFPFDAKLLLRKRKGLKRHLLEQPNLMEKHVAILGGSTTSDVKDMLELFLLNYGIRPVFFESEYAQFWQDAMFENEELKELKPDIIYIHTSYRNITAFPELTDTKEDVDKLLDEQFTYFKDMWEKLEETYHCPIIQNNFEYPVYRLLGNRDAVDVHGRVRFVSELNLRFADYAAASSFLYINDINYQASLYGLEAWADPFYWHMYKYAMSTEAIPTLAFNVANIIKALYGKNKKALALDLDNTLWGGIVGDDGPENLAIGNETSVAQAYTEFQKYLKDLKKQGILLNVISKNEEDAAMGGLNHPDMTLKPDDFVEIKANWDPKSKNLVDIAQEINLLPESFVFVDDNPAEREIVRQQVPGVGIPELSTVEHYIQAVDHAGYFENTQLSKDDLKRSEMYRENVQREKLKSSFENYDEYLLSLEMKGVVKPFEPLYMARIAQLTNKSNQFNLTTRRYTQEEIEQTTADAKNITLYGKLEDRFGDNGVVSLVIGRENEENPEQVDIILWLMSCRVLKRNMEDAMLDALVEESKARGAKKIVGYYYPTAKNKMVREFYGTMGFTKVSEDEAGNSVWELADLENYQTRNHVISMN